LEGLVARIDAPQLHDVDILFFNQLVMDTRQLPQFFSDAPILMSYNRADVMFDDGRVVIRLDPHPQPTTPGDSALMVGVSCGGADWQSGEAENMEYGAIYEPADKEVDSDVIKPID
jgi:hypothetical protein